MSEGFLMCDDCKKEGWIGCIHPTITEENKTQCCVCLKPLVIEEKRGEPGGLHMNDDGTATLYPVGIAKYEKIQLTLNRNKLATEILEGLKCREGNTVLEKSYLNLLIKTLEG